MLTLCGFGNGAGPLCVDVGLLLGCGICSSEECSAVSNSDVGAGVCLYLDRGAGVSPKGVACDLGGCGVCAPEGYVCQKDEWVVCAYLMGV